MTDKQRSRIKAWVAALRSGEYEQGYDHLRTGRDHYCCMGVACDLHAKATGGQWDGETYLDERLHMPLQVAAWLGIGSADTAINSSVDPMLGGGFSLAQMNDVLHCNFRKIATAIENTWLKPGDLTAS